jgi:hypothetical protein
MGLRCRPKRFPKENAVAKVKNVGTGIYADGEIFVNPGEVVEVSDDKAKYLCDAASPGRFELLKPEKPTIIPEKPRVQASK